MVGAGGCPWKGRKRGLPEVAGCSRLARSQPPGSLAAALYVHDVAHQSSSHEQQAAEAVILAALAVELGCEIAPRSMQLPGGARVDVDGVADTPLTFVEVFAHQGALRGSQHHKVSTDALKLITLARSFPDARLILAFGDEAACRSLLGRSWKAEALKTWGVEVFVAEIDDQTREGLMTAQVRQRMVNPAAE